MSKRTSENIVTEAEWRPVLNLLVKAYPEPLFGQLQEAGLDKRMLVKTLKYLEDRGLIEGADISPSGWDEETGETEYVFSPVSITAKGYDMTLPGGGLSRILATVPIILDEEQVKNLLLESIAAIKADDTTKGKLMSALKSLPADGMKAACMTLIETGLAHTSDFLSLFSR